MSQSLGKHDEEFMERDHQNGCLNEKRSSNLDDYSEKVKLHANWDISATCPDILDVKEEYEQKRRKCKADDNRSLMAEEEKVDCLEVKKPIREMPNIERRVEPLFLHLPYNPADPPSSRIQCSFQNSVIQPLDDAHITELQTMHDFGGTADFNSLIVC